VDSSDTDDEGSSSEAEEPAIKDSSSQAEEPAVDLYDEGPSNKKAADDLSDEQSSSEESAVEVFDEGGSSNEESDNNPSQQHHTASQTPPIDFPASQVVEDVSVSRDHRVFEWGLTVNQNQKKDYIRKQLRKDTSSIYEKSTRFLQLAAKLQCWTAHEGLYLSKKNCVYQALSLSLSSTGRESKRRGRGEFDPDQVQPPGQLPFLANAFHTRPVYGSSFLVIGRYTLIWFCLLFWFRFTLRLDVGDLMRLRYMRWARVRCRCVLIVYM